MHRFLWYRCKYRLLILALGAALLLHKAHAAVSCTGIPPSQLQIFNIETAPVEVITVSPEELETHGQDGDLASHHTLMRSVVHLVSWFDVTHRIIPRDDGLVCDAPSSVRMGFGLGRRTVLLAQPAADDGCVRRLMLDHEIAHARAFAQAVDDFIGRRSQDIKRGMIALKATPAPDPAVAKARWEAGLRAIAVEAQRELFEELRAAITKIDHPAALAALENACGGRLRRLESGDG